MLVSQRERLIEAAVDVVGSKGYSASTVGDIIGAARVSRSTFYEQFADKQSCFVAAYQEGSRAHFEQVLTAARGVETAIARLQAGVRAYLDALATEAAYARIALIEVLAAGPTAATARESTDLRYAALLRKWHAEARHEYAGVPQMPDEVFRCAVGGANALVAHRVRHDRNDQVRGLAPVIVTFLLNLGAVPAGRDLAAALSASRAGRA